MSKQADIEFLFILALENYAKTNNLTYEESAGIFHKNNIMEKMLVQHEFNLIDIFDVKNTHNIFSNESKKDSGSIPYLCESSVNNGVNSYISYNEELIEKVNCIFSGGKTFYGRAYGKNKCSEYRSNSNKG